MNHEKWKSMTDIEKMKWKAKMDMIRTIFAAIVGATIVTLLLR